MQDAEEFAEGIPPRQFPANKNSKELKREEREIVSCMQFSRGFLETPDPQEE